jgi:hypothetical protein
MTEQAIELYIAVPVGAIAALVGAWIYVKRRG